MGYNLERLKRQYGIGASKQSYSGTTDADRTAYDKYSDEYLRRLQNTSMYGDGQLYDSILSGPEYEEVVSPITGPVEPIPITTPVVTPGSGINGGGNGQADFVDQVHADRMEAIRNGEITPSTSSLGALFENSMYGKLLENTLGRFGGHPGQTYWESQAPPEHSSYYAEHMDKKPWYDQFTYERTAEERANPSGASVWTTGTGAPVLDGNQQPVRTSNYRPPLSSGMSRDIVAPRTGHPSFMYNSPVTNPLGALSNITGQQFTGANTGALYDANEFSGTGMTTGAAPMGVALNSGTPYDANEFSGTGMTMGSDFAPAPVAPAPVLVDPGADFLARSQALSNEFNIPLGEAFDLADKISQQTTSNIQSVIPPSAPARGSTARSDRGPGRKGRQASASNKSATSRSANPQRSSGGYSWGLAEGGHIKGYAMGGPENRYEIDDATDLEVLSAEATDLEMLATQAHQMSQPSDRANELMTMLQNNTANPNSYSAQLATEQGSYNEAATAFQEMVAKMADNQSRGPDESEKWFRLAAAFGAPTKSGHFTENLGLASSELADISAERRTAGAAGDALKMQGAQFGLELLKDQMDNTRGLSAIERQENKDTQKMLLEWQRDNDKLAQERLYDLAVIAGEREYEGGKPKSEAAKIATDMGLEGEAYNAYIKKYYNDKQTLAELELEVLTNSANQLSSGEMKAIDAVDERLAAADATVDLLVEAIALNKLAYANNLGDWASSLADLATNPEDPRYVATQKLELILKKVAASTLKATFGGAGITDGEREALEKVQGLGLRDSETRGDVIRLGLKAMRSVQRKNMEKRKSILDRTAYKVTKPGAEK